jgi:hypothetical protein
MVLRGAVGGFDSPALPFSPVSRNPAPPLAKEAPPSATWPGSVTTSVTPLPDVLAAYVQAAGQLAAAAVERGDRAEARRALEGALRALELGADGAPALRAIR